MRCIIGTHVSHLHIRIVFGRLYQIGFHFKALARRRKTIAQITSAIIINFLHGTLHLGSHHLHKRIGLCLTIGRFQTEKQLFGTCQIAQQTFF